MNPLEQFNILSQATGGQTLPNTSTAPPSVNTVNTEALTPVSAPVVNDPAPAPLPPVPSAPEPTTPEAPMFDLEKSITDLEKTSGTIEGQNREQDLAVATANEQKAINEINLQIAQHEARALKAEEDALKRGETLDFARGEAAEVRREATFEALRLSALAQAKQGSLALATQLAGNAIDAKYKKQEAELKARRNNIISNYENLTKEQKKRADAALLELDSQDAFVKEQKATQSSILEIANDTASKARDAGVVISNRDLQRLQNAKSIEEAQQISNSLIPAKSNTTGGGVLSTLPVSLQNRVLGMATNFGSNDIVKKFNATADAINIVNGISKDSKNPADHQTIVYSFAKSLDPDSVVREGEYNTIKIYAQSLLDRYGKEITNAIAGTGFLSEKAIKDIQTTMNNNYKNRKPAYDNLYSQTSRVIDNVAGKSVAGEILVDYTGGVTPTGLSSEKEQKYDNEINLLPPGTIETETPKVGILRGILNFFTGQ